MIKYMAVAVAVTVSGGVTVPVAVPVGVRVAGLTKRFFNHIQKRFLNQCLGLCRYAPLRVTSFNVFHGYDNRYNLQVLKSKVRFNFL